MNILRTGTSILTAIKKSTLYFGSIHLKVSIYNLLTLMNSVMNRDYDFTRGILWITTLSLSCHDRVIALSA